MCPPNRVGAFTTAPGGGGRPLGGHGGGVQAVAIRRRLQRLGRPRRVATAAPARSARPVMRLAPRRLPGTRPGRDAATRPRPGSPRTAEPATPRCGRVVGVCDDGDKLSSRGLGQRGNDGYTSGWLCRASAGGGSRVRGSGSCLLGKRVPRFRVRTGRSRLSTTVVAALRSAASILTAVTALTSRTRRRSTSRSGPPGRRTGVKSSSTATAPGCFRCTPCTPTAATSTRSPT
jgi:hypothetical protein